MRVQAHFLGRIVLFTLLLSVVASLAAFAQAYEHFIPIWPSSGIGLALLWRHGARYWPAIFLSDTALTMISGTPMLAASGNGWLEVLIMMTALRLLQHWQVRTSLPDVRQFFRFVAALLVASSLAIPIYGLRVYLLFQQTPSHALALGASYFVSQSFSLLIFTPLIVAWSQQKLPYGRNRGIFLASMCVLTVACFAVLSVSPALQDRLLFLLLPIVVICSVVAGIGGASAASALLAMLLIAMAQTSASIEDTLLRSFFVLSAALTGYLLAVVFGERDRTATEMEFRARHDALTGLLNRYEFECRVHVALRDLTRPHALLYLDLDQFKLVNDTCGHLAGDDMLRQLARTIEQSLPQDAALARLGGDEFACLLPDATVDGVEGIARKLHDAVRSFEFCVDERRFTVDVSIGTTFLSPADDHSYDDVLARADVACYVAKEQGRNRTHAYNAADAAMRDRHSDIQRISQLRAGLAGGLFQLYAQRIVNIDAATTGENDYEVLLRHADPNSTMRIENVFELAQRYGLSAKIDHWVLEQTAQFLRNHSGTNLRLNVNVAATTLESEGFLEFVLALPERHGFLASQLVLEITEAVAVQNLTRAVQTLRTLSESGIAICLDDFGTGVASFGYLSDLPVSIVKIDGRFVRDLGADPAAEIVIESLTRIAALRNIRCVAEWVEDLAVIPQLRKLGVTHAQGHAIHRPAPLALVMCGLKDHASYPNDIGEPGIVASL
ncbi:MAG: EAL domain-containing protein [Rudaea sp.]